MLVPLKILPPQKKVTGLELTGRLQIPLVNRIEVYGLGAQKLPQLEAPLATLSRPFPTVHRGMVQHLIRVMLGVLELVLTVPLSRAHLPAPALMPPRLIPTLALPLKLPVIRASEGL